jgi:hypothetical protein
MNKLNLHLEFYKSTFLINFSFSVLFLVISFELLIYFFCTIGFLISLVFIETYKKNYYYYYYNGGISKKRLIIVSFFLNISISLIIYFIKLCLIS